MHFAYWTIISNLIGQRQGRPNILPLATSVEGPDDRVRSIDVDFCDIEAQEAVESSDVCGGWRAYGGGGWRCICIRSRVVEWCYVVNHYGRVKSQLLVNADDRPFGMLKIVQNHRILFTKAFSSPSDALHHHVTLRSRKSIYALCPAPTSVSGDRPTTTAKKNTDINSNNDEINIITIGTRTSRFACTRPEYSRVTRATWAHLAVPT